MDSISTFLRHIAEQFAYTSWPEWLGVITGFACIYLAAKEKVLSWPVSIVSVLTYAWVFYDARMYGDMILQFYFLLTAFYGWFYWNRTTEQPQKAVTSLRLRDWVFAIISVSLLSVLLGLFLDHFTNSDVPYADGYCTAMSFVAQYLLTRKVLQNWVMWIIVDLCYIPLYIYKNLNLSAVFYAFLIVIAFKGYSDWKKTYVNQTS
ncbi:nicotinamide riboside transporter PnuC [Pedobacter deserti]|uniref:nicotinamide riboside transporter PnuC n=1 Tax=Pedobacter deserti TaxID=2817382 RepID=UPI00210DCDDD|nr:nicotinamide riboside transporter PnuC [Pedobacter sp. SYSU D00382]